MPTPTERSERDREVAREIADPALRWDASVEVNGLHARIECALAAVREEEREGCAKEAECFECLTGQQIAKEIRARGGEGGPS